jgi:hypothetical protein
LHLVSGDAGAGLGDALTTDEHFRAGGLSRCWKNHSQFFSRDFEAGIDGLLRR